MRLSLTVGRWFAGLALALAGLTARVWFGDDDIDPAALSATPITSGAQAIADLFTKVKAAK